MHEPAVKSDLHILTFLSLKVLLCITI